MSKCACFSKEKCDAAIKESNDKRPQENYLNLIENKDDINFKSLKNEGKIRIYFYGKNLLNLLIEQSSHQEKNYEENNINYKGGFESALNWEYFIFDEITKEANEVIANKIEQDFLNNDFFDIIIITVKKLLDSDSLLFYKYFEQFTNQKVKQPFILFLTEEENNPTIEQLFSYNSNEYFDTRTIYALKYPTLDNVDDIKKIFELICKFRNYYHEEGDSFESFNEEISTNYKFNILVCGRAGTGKSSFINKFLGSRKAKEGEGLSVTHKIVTYSHPHYPINISDTPGFEDEKTLEKVKKLLFLYNKQLINAKKKINLIIYLFPYSERSVLSLELPLLENLKNYNTDIIFVMNHVNESINKNHYKRIRDIFIDSLNKIFNNEIDIQLYPINLISQIDGDEDEPENIKVIKAFGLDTLFEQIYLHFNIYLKDLDKIKIMKSSQELFGFLGKNQLFNHFKRINDLFISFRSELINIILSYGRLNKISFKKDKNMEEMANLLFMKCIGKKCYKLKDYLSELVLDDDVEKYFAKFAEDINILRSYNQAIHTRYFYKLIHDHKTLALGYLCIKDLQAIFESSSNIFMENDKLNYDLINNLFDSYKYAINGFNLLSQKFKKIYDDEDIKNKHILKKYKSKSELKDCNSEENNLIENNIIKVNEKIKEE